MGWEWDTKVKVFAEMFPFFPLTLSLSLIHAHAYHSIFVVLFSGRRGGEENISPRKYVNS